MIPRGLYRRDLPHGLMFHRFRGGSSTSAWQGALTPEEFEQILLLVGIDRILSPDQWMAKLADDRLEDDDLCVTFDDGLRSQVDLALPILERYGLTAFWFVYSCVFDRRWVKSEIHSYVAGEIGGMAVLLDEFFERCPGDVLAPLETDAFVDYASRQKALSPFYSDTDLRYRFLRNNPLSQAAVENVMDLIVAAHGFSADTVAESLWLGQADLATLTASGHHIGLHTYDHPYAVGTLDLEAQRVQYRRNFEDILRLTGRKPDSMSHPLSSYNQDSLTVLSELGIQCGFRAFMSPVARTAGTAGHLELAREDATTLLAMLPQVTG